MCNFGISPDNFNPKVFYILKRKFNYESNLEYHCHDFVSMIFVLSGTCTYKINNELYQVKKGDLVICNPGVHHIKILAPGEEIMEFHAGFSNIYIKNLSKNFIIAGNACPVISLLKYEQDFYKCCSEMLLEQEKNEPGCDLVLKSQMMKLIVIFLKETRCDESSEPGSTFTGSAFSFETYDRVNIVNTIVSFINENYMKEISLDKISKNMYLSPAYISKIFKEETGESPINYLIKTRLSKAEDMIREDRFSIKAIAKSIGYHDVYYFSKLFKKYYGCSPSKFRAVE